MYRAPETEALIVGAGPVGLFTAVRLVAQGVPVRILDEEWQTASRSYGLALHPQTLGLLAEADLLKDVVARGVRIDRVAYYRGSERVGQVELADASLGLPFAIVLPQGDLESVLQMRLRDLGGTVQWNHRFCGLSLPDAQPVAEIGRLAPPLDSSGAPGRDWVVEELRQARPRFLIGADGHRSGVRRRLGIPNESFGPDEMFLVFEFECASAPRDEVRVVLGDDETSVLWPLPGKRVRWSFGLAHEAGVADPRLKRRIEKNPTGRAFPKPTHDLLRELLAHRAPWFDGRPGELHWTATVPFPHCVAQSFGEDHVWLLGDTIHQTGPIGVQSMNAGLIEAHDFAERLVSILLDRADLGALEDWQNVRRAEWLRLLEPGSAYEAGPDAPDWVRAAGGRLAGTLPATGRPLEAFCDSLGLTRARTTTADTGRHAGSELR